MSVELRIEAQGPIEVWTIDGAARRNCISRAMLAELAERVAGAAARKVRVVVLTGAGDQAFCAGADLKERAGMSEREVMAFLGTLRETLRAMERSDAIFIAAINGAALGGGLELALACDLRFAAQGALLALPEVSLGIIPGGGGTQRLARLIGPERAKALTFTARRIEGSEALSLGLVTDCAPDAAAVIARALECARMIAVNAPIALAAAKHAINEGLDATLDDALHVEFEHYLETLKTKDRLEGLAAFREKRKPVYRGE